MDDIVLKKFINGREKLIIKTTEVYEKNKEFYKSKGWKEMSDKEFGDKYEEE